MCCEINPFYGNSRLQRNNKLLVGARWECDICSEWTPVWKVMKVWNLFRMNTWFEDHEGVEPVQNEHMVRRSWRCGTCSEWTPAWRTIKVGYLLRINTFMEDDESEETIQKTPSWRMMSLVSVENERLAGGRCELGTCWESTPGWRMIREWYLSRMNTYSRCRWWECWIYWKWTRLDDDENVVPVENEHVVGGFIQLFEDLSIESGLVLSAWCTEQFFWLPSIRDCGKR